MSGGKYGGYPIQENKKSIWHAKTVKCNGCHGKMAFWVFSSSVCFIIIYVYVPTPSGQWKNIFSTMCTNADAYGNKFVTLGVHMQVCKHAECLPVLGCVNVK